MKGLSRRDFISTSAAASLLALVGCSSSSTTAATTSAAASEADVEAESLNLVEEGKLTVASSPDFPPFENLENGEYVGFEVELIKLIAEKLDLEVEFKNLQFDAIIPAIVAGGQADCGLSGFTITPERKKEVNFTDSYYTDDLCVITLKSNTDITADNYDDALNAADIIIACQTGTTGETYAKENYPTATVSGFGNANDTFAALQAGQANAIVTNWAVGASMLDSYTDTQMIGEIATGENYGICVNLDNEPLLMALNGCIEELDEAGTIDELIDTWVVGAGA